MTEQDVQRRLARLRVQPTLPVKSDDYLMELLRRASESFCSYCNRDDPGERVDGLICRLATAWSNQEGAEGSTSASEGGISRAWEGIPSDILREMKSYRKVLGLGV